MTGVQTCALPILIEELAELLLDLDTQVTLVAELPRHEGTLGHDELRSEERRVGKEGRSRWSPDH